MPRGSTTLLETVRQSLVGAGLEHGDGVVVGLSGGVDSLSLTHALQTLNAEGDGPEILAVHVDHGLRPGSANDAMAVERRAKELGVAVEVVRVDVACWDTGHGIEASARDARYAALARVANERRIRWILLGHTQDDQAETVLMRLARGTSLDGLTGMRELSTRSIVLEPAGEETTAVTMLRPLLSLRRSDIEAYAAEHGLEPVEDESNVDARFRRNAIRHQVLPLLEQLVPGATASIARSAGLLIDDAAFITSLAEDAAFSVCERADACVAIKREPFRELALPVQRRVLVVMLHDLDRTLELTAERVEALRRAAVHGSVSTEMQLGQLVVAYVDYDRVVVGHQHDVLSTLRRAAAAPMLESISVICVNGESTVALGQQWDVEIQGVTAPGRWSMRTRRPGDRVRLTDGRSQRLQDWFVNRKVPRYLRDVVPLLVEDGTIRWVLGFSTRDFYDVDSGLIARLRERSTEDRVHVQLHSEHPAS